jgi:hypothetical protein
MDAKTSVEILKISSNIIEILENRDDLPNGDFQGCIEAQVMSAYYLGQNSKKEGEN